ncbi:MAG: lysylphosphatidylglycerol synthase transmembrane domain-containing protein [Candidatus Pacebacteria bacterium]|nr:lysylphosphatidylglycerol synthase transmembrane domain-containing protein [Candidatus Paceibacterota bacterium]
MANKGKKLFLFLASLVLGFFLFVSAFQQVGVSEIMETLSTFSREALVVVCFLNFFAVFIIGSLRWQMILRSQGCRIKFFKVLRAKMAGFTVSYITPSVLVGGEPVRAYMIKEESNCSWERSLASVVVDQAIFLAALFLSVLIGFAYLLEHFSLPQEVLYSFMAVFFFSCSIFYLFYKKIITKGEDEQAFFTFLIHRINLDRIKFVKSKMKSIQETELDVERFFKGDKKYFLLVVSLGLLEAFCYLLVVSLICFYLGVNLGIFRSAGIFSLVTLANLVPIPGSLGSFEVALTFAFYLLGIGKDAGLAFSLIFRFINIMLCLVGFFAILHFTIITMKHRVSFETPPIFAKLHRFFINFVPKDWR